MKSNKKDRQNALNAIAQAIATMADGGIGRMCDSGDFRDCLEDNGSPFPKTLAGLTTTQIMRHPGVKDEIADMMSTLVKCLTEEITRL